MNKSAGGESEPTDQPQRMEQIAVSLSLFCASSLLFGYTNTNNYPQQPAGQTRKVKNNNKALRDESHSACTAGWFSRRVLRMRCYSAYFTPDGRRVLGSSAAAALMRAACRPMR